MTDEELKEVELRYLGDVNLSLSEYRRLFDRGLELIHSEPQPRRLLLEILDEYQQRLDHLPAVDLSVTNLQALDEDTREQVKALILFGTQAALIKDNSDTQNKLRTANSNYRDLLSVVTHEFKNSLTSIYGYNRIIKKRAQDGNADRIEEVCNQVDRLAKSLFGLVDTLFSMSLIEQGKLRVDKKVFDLVEDAIQPVLTDLKHRFLQSNLSVSIDSKESKNIYWGDERFFQLVFRNLIQNAIQYGKARSEIKISIRRSEEHLEISVFNYGTGLEKDKLDQVFDKFSRFHDTPDRSNVGIGLYAVKNIIELHNGTIRAESDPDKWMRFVIDLPLDFEI